MFTKPYEAAGNPATEMSAKWLAELVRVLEDLLWEWEYQLEPLWGFQDAFRTLLPDLYSAIDSVVRNDDSALRIGQRDFGRMRRAPLFGRVHVRVGATWKLWQIICSLERASPGIYPDPETLLAPCRQRSLALDGLVAEYNGFRGLDNITRVTEWASCNPAVQGEYEWICAAIVQTVARGRDLHRPRLKLADKLPRLPEEAAEILMIHDPVSG